MGLLGAHSKLNLGKTRFETGLLCLLFISIYQAYSLVYQGLYWAGLLFVLSGSSQLYALIAARQKAIRFYLPQLCLSFSWLAFLSAFNSEHLLSLDWLAILIIAGYLLLNSQLANIINGLGFSVLFGFSISEQGLFTSIIQLLPFFVLFIIANLLVSQNAFLDLMLKKSEVSDRLTGCSNREYFLQEVIKSSDIYNRYKIDVSLIALDMCIPPEEIAVIGREKFDQCQISLSEIWTSRLRNTDILCRYHDGLFIILLPSTSFDNALLLANDLTKASGDYDLDISENIKVIAKIAAHDPSESWENWLNRVVL